MINPASNFSFNTAFSISEKRISVLFSICGKAKLNNKLAVVYFPGMATLSLEKSPSGISFAIKLALPLFPKHFRSLIKCNH